MLPAAAARPRGDDSKWIAYADKVGIHLVHPDGSAGHMLVAKWGARYPSWSPSGKWLAYAQLSHHSTETSTTPIRIIRPDGRDARTIAQGFDPEWLDNTWILFHPDSLLSIQHQPSPEDLFREVNVTTGEVKTLTIPQITSDTQYRYWGGGFPDYQLSPQRDAILWEVSQPDKPNGNSACGGCVTIESVHLDGTDYRRLDISNAYYAGVGGWMPSGDSATYPCFDKKKGDPLCVANLVTGTTRELPGTATYHNEWSSPAPTGARMVVGAGDALYTIGANDANPRLLFKVYTQSGNPTSPVWQP